MLGVGALALVLVLVATLKYLGRLLQLRRANFPPGPPCLPLLGALSFVPGELIHLHAEKKWRNKYGPLVGLPMPRDDMVLVCGGKEALAILAHEDCQARSDMFFATERSFGKKLGIMFSDGPYWTEQRRFALRELRDLGMGKSKMEGVVLAEVDATLQAILRDGPAVQPNRLFNAPVLNVLWWMVSGKPFAHGLGKQQDPRSKRLQEVMENFMRSKSVGTAPVDSMPILKYIAPGLSLYNAIYQPIFDMQAFIKDEIKLQRENRSDSYIGNYVDRMEQTTDPNSGLTDESLIISVMDIFIAGGESTGNTLSFCLLYMALNPSVQAKVHAELDSVCGGPAGVISLADKARMPYTEATMTEVMRINTIAPIAVPHKNTKDITINGVTIPKGSMIMISLWSVLHDKEHWGDPEVFRPERFIGQDGSFVKDPWVVNFGHGKRLCIGETFAVQTAFLFFANLMNRLRFRFPPGTTHPGTVAKSGFTVTPQDYTVLAELRSTNKS